MTQAELEHPGGTVAAPAESGALKWLMLLAIFTVQTTYQLGLQSPSPLAPFLMSELQISRAQIGLLSSAVSLGALFVAIPSGWIADRFGSRPLLSGGALIVGIFLVVASRATSFWPIAACMLILGLGMGLASTGATKAVVSWFTARTRGTAMGIKQTGTSLGTAIGAAILPGLALAVDWRYAMALAGFTVAAAGIACLLVYHEHARPATPAGINESQGSLRSVLASRNVQLCAAAGVCFTAAQLILSAYLVLYFVEARRMEVTAAGNLLAAMQLISVAGRIGLGVVSDRLLGTRRKGLLVTAGTAMMMAGVVVAFYGSTMPFGWLFALMLLVGLSGFGWTGLMLILFAEVSEQRSLGMTVAVLLASTYVGYFIGPPLFGWIVDVSRSYAPAWLALAFLSGAGALAISRVRERHDVILVRQ